MMKCSPAAVLALALLPAVFAAAQQPAGPERWDDLASGLSLRPPPGAPVQSTGRGDELMRIEGLGNGAIRLLMKDAGEPVEIDTVIKKANEQLLFLYPSAVAMKHRRLRVDGREAALVYFLINDGKRPAWVFGQGFLMLDPQTVAVLNLDVDEPLFEDARAVFEGVFASISFADAKTMEQRRAQWLDQGRAWLATIKPPAVEATLTPERWFRILEKDLDVGYMRVRMRRDQEMNQKGFRVDVQVRTVQGENAVDTLSNYFLADTMVDEYWSIRSTLRPLQEHDHPRPPAAAPQARVERDAPAPAAPPLMSWAETGVRSSTEVSVSRQSPAGVKQFRWGQQQMPPVYLPMVLQEVAGAMLPRDKEATYGFYAYDPQRQKIALRTLRVVPRGDGGYDVLERPALDVPEQRAVYDRYGRLISQEIGDGRVLLPGTPQQVQTIWRLRE